jgi:hypothetical protein
MKNLLLVIVCALLLHSSANAQWYERSCGVPDLESASPDEFACMWNRADAIVQFGMKTCGIGTGIAVMGGVAMFVSSGPGYESSSGYSMIGALGLVCGLATVTASIPIWTVGASRKSRLSDSPHYPGDHAASIQILPMFRNNDLNRQGCVGLSASLSF